MDNELLIAAIDAAEQSSYSSEGDSTLSTDRAYAIDMYLGKNLEPAPEGRSQVIDRSVFETIQWILPSLVDIYANGDDVIEIAPVSAEDEPGAKQETQYLNHLILQKNNWFVTFITWAMDAMMTKNGYCLAYSEKRRNEEIDRYERQTEQAVAMLQQDKDVQVEVTAQYPDPDYVPQPQPAVDPMTGQPVIGPDGQPVMQLPPPAPMLFDVTVTRVQEERKVCIKVLPPERCKISYRTPDFSISQECPYFEYYDHKTLSDLRADGFKLPDIIPDDWQIDEEEDLARDQYDEEGWRDNDGNEPDETMKRYRVRMIWLLHDDNQDGIAERVYAVRIGRHILHKEQVSRIPAASLVAIPNPHRHIATSISDIVVDLQRIKTAILRQGLDNLYLANNPRTFINPDKVNLDDALISRPGGVVRGVEGTNAVYGNDIAPLVMPFVFPQAMEGLEYMDQVRENRTGTNRYFTGIDQNAMNKTATGIQQLSSMAAQRVKLIARIMGCGIADLFSIVHELIIKGGHKKEVVKLSNQWIEIDPAQWKKRTDFRISVGYAAGNKDAMVSKLMLIASMQEKALAGGLPIATPDNAYQTAIELTKASDFSSPERFWTDPQKIPPKQPPPDPIIESEKIKSQTTLQKTQAEIEADLYKCEKETQLEKYKVDTDAQVKLTLADAQIESAHRLEDKKGQVEDKKLGVQMHMAESNPKAVEARSKESKTKQEGEFIQQFMQSQQQQTQAIAQMFQEVLGAVQRLGGAKKVVRGKDGRIDSVVPVE